MNKIDKAFALQSRLITNEMRGIYPDTLQDFADLVRADEREAMVAEAAKKGWGMRNDDPFEDCVREIAAIRARGNT